MWTELLDEFEKQEKEDKDRMTTMLETAIREELDCPEHYIDILRGSSFRYPAGQFLPPGGYTQAVGKGYSGAGIIRCQYQETYIMSDSVLSYT